MKKHAALALFEQRVVPVLNKLESKWHFTDTKRGWVLIASPKNNNANIAAWRNELYRLLPLGFFAVKQHTAPRPVIDAPCLNCGLDYSGRDNLDRSGELAGCPGCRNFDWDDPRTDPNRHPHVLPKKAQTNEVRICLPGQTQCLTRGQYESIPRRIRACSNALLCYCMCLRRVGIPLDLRNIISRMVWTDRMAGGWGKEGWKLEEKRRNKVKAQNKIASKERHARECLPKYPWENLKN